MKYPLSVVTALENIYISPLELCNLNCRHCYTNKTRHILDNTAILNFTKKYSGFLRSNSLSLKSILFCGGEVFILPGFTRLINNLLKKGIFISIITNGTVDRLDKIKDPTNCQLLVSLDGPAEIHDKNRGKGNFQKSINFINHAFDLGFPVEIMFLVTPDSYPYRQTMPGLLKDLTGHELNLNYITQKTIFYTDNHPLSNQKNKKPALTSDQIIDIKKNFHSIPDKNFGCFQLSLQSNGNLYGCCESPHSLGTLSDPLQSIIDNFLKALSPCMSCAVSSFAGNQESFRGHSLKATLNAKHSSEPENSCQENSGLCSGCIDPDFLCGYKKELSLSTCQQVVESFHDQK